MAFLINIEDLRENKMAEIFETEKKNTNGNYFWNRNFKKH